MEGLGVLAILELPKMVERENWTSYLAGGRWRGIYTPPSFLTVGDDLGRKFPIR